MKHVSNIFSFFFRILLLIVSFFNRMLRVIFLHKFIWNWKLQQMPRKNDTDRHGSPIIRSRVINLTKHMPQHHAKPMPCIISLYLSFPTRAQFAFDGPLFFSNSYSVFAPDLFEILIDPFVPSKMQRSCTCSCINSALMVLSVPATRKYVEATDCQSVAS